MFQAKMDSVVTLNTCVCATPVFNSDLNRIVLCHFSILPQSCYKISMFSCDICISQNVLHYYHSLSPRFIFNVRI